ncbi:hypothetical protein Avbf_15026 [Armadillidium vulgare]|nr:hypothetical protein Avbf_15026 [Armadillidium vulgare]
MNTKRDKDREDQALKWVKDVTGLSVPDDVDYVEALKDGQLLCTLMNKLVPGSVRKIHTAGPDFKMIENINGFIKGAKDYGVAMNDVYTNIQTSKAHSSYQNLPPENLTSTNYLNQYLL